MRDYDVIIIGGGAAGLMCAVQAGRRGRSVLVIEHARRVGKKILMSGGGRCNFTNMYSGPENFLSRNPHFCKSALSRYTPWDFIALVEAHGIAYHEKKLGQLFCDHKSREIVQLLLNECAAAGVEIRTRCSVQELDREDEGGFRVATEQAVHGCASLVIATGGLSIPKMGATGFGYEQAKRFGLQVVPTRAGLVPFTLDPELLSSMGDLSGISVDCHARCGEGAFRENLLWTHRGLSGPAMLQVSSYWRDGEAVAIDLLPEQDVREALATARRDRPRLRVKSLLAEWLPRRLAERWTELWLDNRRLADLTAGQMEAIIEALQPWRVVPNGTEGYRTAEVTLGGVDTDELSSRTMEVKKIPGLYFIGEVVDVTGHLGGHNFQWAWASGYAAGQVV